LICFIPKEIRYGIKRIDYSDDTVLEFYDEIPKKLDIFAKGANDAQLTVIVTDALGYTYELGGEDEETVLSTYGTQPQP